MDFEKFLLQDEKELLSLVNYHRSTYQNTKIRQGGLHPDDIQIMKLLDGAEDYVKAIAQERKKEMEEEPKESGEEQLKNLEELLVFIDKTPEFSQVPDEIKKDIAELKKQYPICKQKCEEENIAFQKLQQSKKERDKSTAEMRDYLLAAKINDSWKNSPMGES